MYKIKYEYNICVKTKNKYVLGYVHVKSVRILTIHVKQVYIGLNL